MAATAIIHARVEEAIKEQATDVLESMGLTMSGAINIFLTRVAIERAIPFEVRVPNAVTREAMIEADQIVAKRSARFNNSRDLMGSLETPRK